MYGCMNNRSNPQWCTILLIIVILACQGLLDGSCRSRNAITLLLLWWLCCSGRCGGNQCTQAVAPTSGCCGYQSNSCCGCQSNCCGCSRCCCKCKEKKCRCKRVRVCCNKQCC